MNRTTPPARPAQRSFGTGERRHDPIRNLVEPGSRPRAPQTSEASTERPQTVQTKGTVMSNKPTSNIPTSKPITSQGVTTTPLPPLPLPTAPGTGGGKPAGAVPAYVYDPSRGQPIIDAAREVMAPQSPNYRGPT